jgi:hypothetical protein
VVGSRGTIPPREAPEVGPHPMTSGVSLRSPTAPLEPPEAVCAAGAPVLRTS